MNIAARILFVSAVGLASLLAAVSPRVGYAAPGGQAGTDPFDLLIHALRDAEDEKLFYDDSPLVNPTELVTGWFVNEVVSKNVPTSQEQIEDREELLGNIKGQRPAPALEETLVYLRKYDLLDPNFAKMLADWYAEKIVELVKDRDRAALVALYNATNGDDWDNNANWLSDLPLDRWHGVEEAAGRVIELLLDQNGLRGRIPPEIGNLSELRYLLLGGNGLTGEIPSEIGNLSQLYYMDLSDNGLRGEIPPEIGNLSQLQYLRLSNNDLSGQIPMELGNLPNLEQLYLGVNGFTGCVPDNLYDLRTYIPDAPFGDGIWSFDDAHKLNHKFDIPRCGQMSLLAAIYEATDGANWTNNTNWLSDKPASEWHGLALDESSNVVGLELNNNNLSGDIPHELGDLSSLERLSLFGNRLSGDIPAELGSLSNLEYLFLGGNRVGGCLPDGLSYVPRIDISALGVPFCGSGSDAPAPSLALLAFSPSPTEMNLAWPHGIGIESVKIYRNDELAATPSRDRTYYTDSGLSPNVRYEYRVEASLSDGSTQTAESGAATLAYPPRLASAMYITETSFKMGVVDNSNPDWTEYRITLSSTEHDATSDWSASRCRTFEGLTPGGVYGFNAVARNLDGIETQPVTWAYMDYVGKFSGSFTQEQTGNDDPWAIYKINEAARIYGITESERLWMLSDLPVQFYRNEPGVAHSDISGSTHVGNASPGTLMHETMHGYWEHWSGFPQSCDVMNVYTFMRDVGRFLFDFRDYDLSGQPNPLEDWRPFYNFLIRHPNDFSNLIGRPDDPGLRGVADFWELLEEERFEELNPLYHTANQGVPSDTAGKMSLIPPPLRPYFQGYLADESDTTWREELYWYSSLLDQERRLWDTAYNYHAILHHSPQYAAPQHAPRTNIPAQKRELLRNADRRILVDFVNTLEDISCNTQYPCKELWRADFGFWTGYVHRNLYRARLYLDELSADVGVELAPENLAAVKGIMRAMVSDISCDSANPSYLRWHINSATGISDLQRNALLAMVDVLERHPDWWLPCGSDAALADAWAAISRNEVVHSHSEPGGVTD